MAFLRWKQEHKKRSPSPRGSFWFDSSRISTEWYLGLEVSLPLIRLIGKRINSTLTWKPLPFVPTFVALVVFLLMVQVITRERRCQEKGTFFYEFSSIFFLPKTKNEALRMRASWFILEQNFYWVISWTRGASKNKISDKAKKQLKPSITNYSSTNQPFKYSSMPFSLSFFNCA